jgi:hypothetical protein
MRLQTVLLSTENAYVTGAKGKARKNSKTRINKFEIEGFVPAGRHDIKPIKLTLPFDWSFGPPKDPNWRMQLHAWRFLDPYFVLYEESQDVDVIKTIMAYVSDWLDWLLFRADDKGRAWYDMSVSLRSCKIALLYSWLKKLPIYSTYSEILITLILLHNNWLIKRDNFNFGNHGIFHVHALKMFSLMGFYDNDTVGSLNTACQELIGELHDKQFDCEGVHKEGAFEYQRFAIKKFNELIKSGLWESEKVAYITNSLDKAIDCYDFMLHPSGHEIRHGDTVGEYVVKPNYLNDIPEGRTIYKNFQAGYHFLIERGAANNCNHLFISSQKSKCMHGHFDFLNLVWFLNQNKIVDDGGKYAYKKNSQRHFFVSAESHNGPLLKGWSQPDLIAVISDYNEGKRLLTIRGTFKNKKKNEMNLTRAAQLLDDSGLLVIDSTDVISSCMSILWRFAEGISLKTISFNFFEIKKDSTVIGSLLIGGKRGRECEVTHIPASQKTIKNHNTPARYNEIIYSDVIEIKAQSKVFTFFSATNKSEEWHKDQIKKLSN